MEVSSWGGAGGGQEAQGSTDPADTWGRCKLGLVGYYLGCGGREGVAWLFNSATTHSGLISEEAATSLS